MSASRAIAPPAAATEIARALDTLDAARDPVRRAIAELEVLAALPGTSTASRWARQSPAEASRTLADARAAPRLSPVLDRASARGSWAPVGPRAALGLQRLRRTAISTRAAARAAHRTAPVGLEWRG
jgi:hypothetical protein